MVAMLASVYCAGKRLEVRFDTDCMRRPRQQVREAIRQLNCSPNYGLDNGLELGRVRSCNENPVVRRRQFSVQLPPRVRRRGRMRAGYDTKLAVVVTNCGLDLLIGHRQHANPLAQLLRIAE